MRFFHLIFLLTLFSLTAHAQNCVNPGQTPSTAFPVCGTSTFQQANVPVCGVNTLVVPGCTGSGTAVYQDKNPFWYRFTCFQAGTLGFLIKPNNAGDDYDWQLYDITNHNPDDVFTDPSLVVIGNWSGTLGNTGASSTGVNAIQCASNPSDNLNSFSIMPTLIVGHTYLLLVSHFTDSQSGYALSFGGGTAVITDPTLPGLLSAEANCDADRIRLKLKKKVKCSSLALNGSDFFVTPGTATVTSVTGIGCAAGFDTDSIILQLSAPLPIGNYTLHIKNGTDANTLLDNCDNAIATTETVPFTVIAQQPVPMDSLVRPACAPNTLKLVFSRPLLCSSVAPDGSDFSINGPYPATIASATTSCAGSLTREITLTLTQPMFLGGTFSLVLKRGSDGNSLLDECLKETPVGSNLPFTLKDTVDASFTFLKTYGCKTDSIQLSHPGTHGVTSWQWQLGDGQTSTQQNPLGLYTVFNTKEISLVVSNGFCTDSSKSTIVLDNFLKADFTTFEDNCPNEPVGFKSEAQGQVKKHAWNFGDGSTESIASPTHTYSGPSSTKTFEVSYTVTDSIGCQSTAKKNIKIYSSCYIAVPNAFTPNNDDKNDFLRVLNAIKAEKLDFRIFNRWGQLIFQTNNWKTGWDGTVNGVKQGTSTYVWFLTYTDRDTKEVRNLKGTATLIR